MRRFLRGDRYGSRSAERLPESREHHKVSVERHALKAAHAQRRESVAVLQIAELALDSATARVQLAEPLAVPWDAREEPSARGDGQGWLIFPCASKRDDRETVALLALGIDPCVVIALVHRARFGPEAASVQRVRSGAAYRESFRRAVSTCQASGSPVAAQTAACSLYP